MASTSGLQGSSRRTSRRNTGQQREESGRFEQHRCGCINHTFYNEEMEHIKLTILTITPTIRRRKTYEH